VHLFFLNMVMVVIGFPVLVVGMFVPLVFVLMLMLMFMGFVLMVMMPVAFPLVLVIVVMLILILLVGVSRPFMDGKFHSLDILPHLPLPVRVEIADLKLAQFPFKCRGFHPQVAQGAHGHIAADAGETIEIEHTHGRHCSIAGRIFQALIPVGRPRPTIGGQNKMLGQRRKPRDRQSPARRRGAAAVGGRASPDLADPEPGCFLMFGKTHRSSSFWLEKQS
jgi:hypothetical protein